jgi:hypothetical protein
MSAMEITFKVSKDARNRIHLHSGNEVWITLTQTRSRPTTAATRTTG